MAGHLGFGTLAQPSKGCSMLAGRQGGDLGLLGRPYQKDFRLSAPAVRLHTLVGHWVELELCSTQVRQTPRFPSRGAEQQADPVPRCGFSARLLTAGSQGCCSQDQSRPPTAPVPIIKLERTAGDVGAVGGCQSHKSAQAGQIL